MQTNEYLPLRMAASRTLRRNGTRIFKTPKAFLGNILDEIDPDAQVTLVLYRNCDKEFLDIFDAVSQSRSPEAMNDAASKATMLLEHGRGIQHGIAEQVACEITFALSNVLGVACPDRVRKVAVQEASQGQQNGAGQVSGNGSNSAWYDAQRARSSVAGTYSSSNSTASPASKAASGPQRTVSQAKAKTGSGTANTQTAGSGTTNRKWVNSKALSTNPKERTRQATEAGFPMAWYGWLKGICVCTALLRLYNLAMFVADFPSDVVRDLPDDMKSWIIFHSVSLLALAVAYIVAWRRLAGFRAKAPKTFLWTLGLNVLFVFVSYGIQRSVVLEHYGVAIDLSSEAFIWICIDLVMLVATHIYLKKRAQFFSL